MRRISKGGAVGLVALLFASIGSGAVAEAQSAARARLVEDGTPSLWPNGEVFYTFAANVTANQRQHFIDAAAEWSTFAKLTFIPRTSESQRNYILVDAAGSECGSVVGMKVGGQLLSLPSGCWERPVLLHEIGHALGFHHEHVRPDRGTFVTVNATTATPCAVWPSTTNLSTYDFRSIMHYDKYCGSGDHSQVILVPRPGYEGFQDEMGTQLGLSRLDRAGVRQAYGPPAQAASAVITNTKDSGPGTLRTAIYYAADRSEVTPGTTTVLVFRIPTSDSGFNGTVFTISLTGGLPSVGDGTIINGATQTTSTGDTNPVGPEVVLNGSKIVAPTTGAGNYASGLVLKGVNSSVRSLVINGFNVDGVVIKGPRATGNTILSSYIGTDRAGTAAVANRGNGVSIVGGAHDNTVGGVAAGHRNIISGNGNHGVSVEGSGSDGNRVQGNYVGVERTGSLALSNAGSGVSVRGGARSNLIGGDVAGARNVVSGNRRNGVELSGTGTNANLVRANLVGLSAGGSAAVPNVMAGVLIDGGAQSNTVGGTSTIQRNVVSGNTGQGLALSGSGTNANVVQGNFIGTNVAGTAAVRNGGNGVDISGGPQSNVVGGGVAGAGNVLSGNAGAGVMIAGAGTRSNRLEGNLIGTSPTGAAALGNGGAGVYVRGGAQSNVIGGRTAAVRNVISANGQQGLVLTEPGTNLNRVEGNYIGTNRAGSGDLGNTGTGVSVNGGAQSNVVGGTAAGAGNTVSGNGSEGVSLSGPDTTLNLVQGNRIGLNAAGTGPLANGLSGVGLTAGASSNTIGGPTAAARNYLSGNTEYGVIIRSVGTSSNLVQGNTVGRRPTGESAPNGRGGIFLFEGPTGNQIGGTAPGTGNVISANAGNGVTMWNDSTIRNPIRGNSISANSRQAIGLAGGVGEDVNGVTPNDVGAKDSDIGPNQLQNYPVIASAVAGSGTVIRASLDSAPNTTFRIEYFSNTSADVGGYGEGATFLGAQNVTTDAAGRTPVVTYTAVAVVPSGHSITATATDPNGNTSEFSLGFRVTATT